MIEETLFLIHHSKIVPRPGALRHVLDSRRRCPVPSPSAERTDPPVGLGRLGAGRVVEQDVARQHLLQRRPLLDARVEAEVVLVDNHLKQHLLGVARLLGLAHGIFTAAVC